MLIWSIHARSRVPPLQVVGLVGGLGLSWQATFGVILTLYFYSHYFFASGECNDAIDRDIIWNGFGCMSAHLLLLLPLLLRVRWVPLIQVEAFGFDSLLDANK